EQHVSIIKIKKTRSFRIIRTGLLSALILLCILIISPSAISAISAGLSSNVSSVASSGSPEASASDISQDGSGVSSSPDITAGPVNPIRDYELDIRTESALVIETGRGMQLYIKNPGIVSQIPIASKLMTALLAVESIPADTVITISSVAASQPDAGVLSLKSGEKYSLEFLLHGLILKDNDAAAIALAEQISGTEEEFVVLMNSRAESYQMTDTVFTNATGNENVKQLTTVLDVSRLFRFAMAFTKFEKIFKTHDSVFILTPKLTKHLISNADDIWSIAEGATGVFRAETKSMSSYAVTAKSGQIGIFVIGAASVKKDVVSDISVITQSVFSDYEFSTLIKEGQLFPQSMTVEGRSFSIRFMSDVNYVHPKSLDFIHDTVYEPMSDIVLPVTTTKAVAKVTFILLDGTTISAELFPTVDIWSDSGIYRKLINIYIANKDIANLIIILTAGMLITLLLKIIQLIGNAVARSHRRTGRRV
ncbi:MAG: D-alanyl-D-alanine carboxypeptidase family protein, partial [Saccharofermentanales bacterium]